MDPTSFYFGVEDLWRVKLSIPQKKEDNEDINLNENIGKDKKWKK
jgi:hypothetical protein